MTSEREYSPVFGSRAAPASACARSHCARCTRERMTPTTWRAFSGLTRTSSAPAAMASKRSAASPASAAMTMGKVACSACWRMTWTRSMPRASGKVASIRTASGWKSFIQQWQRDHLRGGACGQCPLPQSMAALHREFAIILDDQHAVRRRFLATEQFVDARGDAVAVERRREEGRGAGPQGQQSMRQVAVRRQHDDRGRRRGVAPARDQGRQGAQLLGGHDHGARHGDVEEFAQADGVAEQLEVVAAFAECGLQARCQLVAYTEQTERIARGALPTRRRQGPLDRRDVVSALRRRRFGDCRTRPFRLNIPYPAVAPGKTVRPGECAAPYSVRVHFQRSWPDRPPDRRGDRLARLGRRRARHRRVRQTPPPVSGTTVRTIPTTTAPPLRCGRAGRRQGQGRATSWGRC